MKRFIGLALALVLAATAAHAHIGDTLEKLRTVYGSTAKKQGNAMIFQRNGYSICVYFDGTVSGMEIFTRDGSVKGKNDITEADMKGILSMEGEGQGWTPVTSKSGKLTFLREDHKVIARLSEADDAQSGAPGKAFVVMINANSVARRTLIVGCGYLGLSLARELQSRGDEVTAWVRSEDSAAQLAGERFARVITGNVADEACWRALGAFDAVVHCASSGGGGVAAYREVYLEGSRQMNRHQPEARRVLVSSTSVYGQTGGEVVDESSETAPQSETSQVLVQAEREAMSAGAIVVRAAGIYGLNRAALFEKFRRGDAVMEGDGTRWVNQVHRDDLVAAVIRLLEAGAPGEVYNAADDEPVMLRDYYAWCSGKLGKPMPPPGSADPNRKRGMTSKRVSNRKLRALGWVPRHPSFREGLAARME